MTPMPRKNPDEIEEASQLQPKPQAPIMPQTIKDRIVSSVAARFGWLQKAMREGAMNETVEHFVERAMLKSLGLTAILILIGFWFLDVQKADKLLLIPLLFVIYTMALSLFIQEPKAKASKRRRDIDRDLLFAGRHLWIALKGGLPLFDSLVAISKSNYGAVSGELNKVVEKVFIGTPLDTAMQEVVEDNPSPSFRRMMLQIVNSVRSGADVADSLEVVLDQISREQLIDVKEYGQKLNPVVMFYMVSGIIFPSLGVSVGILLLSFAGVKLVGSNIWAFVPLIALVQYMFLTYIEVSKPSYEL
ncbi:Type II secretion system (T2SS), protein F [uncultured archaeon]|nr:Type II secretion system (T2SS), protein F [uncultured archaeon]